MNCRSLKLFRGNVINKVVPKIVCGVVTIISSGNGSDQHVDVLRWLEFNEKVRLIMLSFGFVFFFLSFFLIFSITFFHTFFLFSNYFEIIFFPNRLSLKKWDDFGIIQSRVQELFLILGRYEACFSILRLHILVLHI